MAEPRIFVSMGTPYSETYAVFRTELAEFLRLCGADPRIIGVNEYPEGNPLPKIRDVMKSCHGVIVVAYERKFVEKGAEKRGSENEQALERQFYTTPWNHIESAMAYSLGIPLYIICENGLAEDGLIETKIDWYVQYMNLQTGAFNDPKVAESLRSWIKHRVLVQSSKPRAWRVIEGGLKLNEMTPKEIRAVLGVLFAVFAAGAAAGRFIPQIFG